jgi:hypothetical protein
MGSGRPPTDSLVPVELVPENLQSGLRKKETRYRARLEGLETVCALLRDFIVAGE